MVIRVGSVPTIHKIKTRYFKALANHEIPPVKERLEMPITSQKTDTGLTPGLLRVLNNQVIHSFDSIVFTDGRVQLHA